MKATIRASLAAILIAAAAFAGAFYIGSHERRGASDLWGPDEQVASINLHNILGQSDADRQLIGLAFRELERNYYKPFDPQTIVKGERSGLLSYLKSSLKKDGVQPNLPARTASSDQVADLHVLDQQLDDAITRYGQRTGGATVLTEAALSGMLNALGDPYTEYLSPQQIRSLNEQLSGGNFGGIGVFILEPKRNEVILQPIQDLPADRAGMKGVQILDDIDGHPITGFTLDKVERLIRGPEGTQVTLTAHTYKGNSVRRNYRITREIIHVPTVRSKMENGYDYIRLLDFGETSAAEVRKALAAGQAQHAKGYILDLRYNGGGLLDAAVDISSYFIPSGTIVTEIDRDGNQHSEYATGTYMQGLQPLVVLVNGFSASASEITAGALEDHRVATLIGTRTFGKGVVQGIFRMPNGGALKITTQRYLTPSGRDIQHKGIQPQISVMQKADTSLIDTPSDKQLEAAKAFLSRSVR